MGAHGAARPARRGGRGARPRLSLLRAFARRPLGSRDRHDGAARRPVAAGAPGARRGLRQRAGGAAPPRRRARQRPERHRDAHPIPLAGAARRRPRRLRGARRRARPDCDRASPDRVGRGFGGACRDRLRGIARGAGAERRRRHSGDGARPDGRAPRRPPRAARGAARPRRPAARDPAGDRRRLVGEPVAIRHRLRLALARAHRAHRPRGAREDDARPVLGRRARRRLPPRPAPAPDGPAHPGLDPAGAALAQHGLRRGRFRRSVRARSRHGSVRCSGIGAGRASRRSTGRPACRRACSRRSRRRFPRCARMGRPEPMPTARSCRA